MELAIVTGSTGLVGSEAVEFLSGRFDRVIGIDNDLRKKFFGEEASTAWNERRLRNQIPNYSHKNLDIRDGEAMRQVFAEYSSDIKLVIHAAAQPSHDWAANEPLTDFTVNANGTLNLLEATRLHAPRAVFIFTSTNKVYGDLPNHLPLTELETRWELKRDHPYYKEGIDESMSLDGSTHSLFGASKVAADVLTQEYGRYFGIRTGVFRCGCITGPKHSGAALHGFLSYLVKCAVTGIPYSILGYKGKQVRDNVHSQDLVSMFWHFYLNPRAGEVYNAGGGRFSNCSILEAIRDCEEITRRPMNTVYRDEHRMGDHMWWISDVTKFKRHYPGWKFQYGLKDILRQIHQAFVERTTKTVPLS